MFSQNFGKGRELEFVPTERCLEKEENTGELDTSVALRFFFTEKVSYAKFIQIFIFLQIRFESVQRK